MYLSRSWIFILVSQKRIIVENCFSNIKKFGFFQRRKRRGGLYDNDTLAKLFTFACALHNAEQQIDMIARCRPFRGENVFLRNGTVRKVQR